MVKISEYSDNYTPEDAAKRHFAMKQVWKNGKVTCKFEKGKNTTSDDPEKTCGKVFFVESNSYQTHLLFDHYVFRGTCGTKVAKKIEWDCINGFAKRPEILRIKREQRKGMNTRRTNIIATFRRFWENINEKT